MRRIIPPLATLALMALAFLIYLPATSKIAYAATTTIIGWNFPNGTTLGQGIGAFIIPIIVTGLFVGLPVGIGMRGSAVTLMMKLALLIGTLVAMLSLNASPSNLEPIAFPIVAAVYLVTYLWKGI